MARVAPQIQNVFTFKPLWTKRTYSWVFTSARVAVAVILVVVPILELLFLLLLRLVVGLLVLATS